MYIFYSPLLPGASWKCSGRNNPAPRGWGGVGCLPRYHLALSIDNMSVFRQRVNRRNPAVQSAANNLQSQLQCNFPCTVVYTQTSPKMLHRATKTEGATKRKLFSDEIWNEMQNDTGSLPISYYEELIPSSDASGVGYWFRQTIDLIQGGNFSETNKWRELTWRRLLHQHLPGCEKVNKGGQGWQVVWKAERYNVSELGMLERVEDFKNQRGEILNYKLH